MVSVWRQPTRKAGWRSDLSVSQEKTVDVLRAQGDRRAGLLPRQPPDPRGSGGDRPGDANGCKLPAEGEPRWMSLIYGDAQQFIGVERTVNLEEAFLNSICYGNPSLESIDFVLVERLERLGHLLYPLGPGSGSSSRAGTPVQRRTRLQPTSILSSICMTAR